MEHKDQHFHGLFFTTAHKKWLRIANLSPSMGHGFDCCLFEDFFYKNCQHKLLLIRNFLYVKQIY